MRLYDIGLASFAIDAPLKWTDNLLSQHFVPGVRSIKRGVARQFSYQTLVRLAIIRQLHTSFGVSVAEAVKIADELWESDGHFYSVGPLRLILDMQALEHTLQDRLRDAHESVPVRKRGRPPKPDAK